MTTIFERSDYVNATKKLREAVAVAAGPVLKKMKELDVGTIYVDGVEYHRYSRQSSMCTQDFIGIDGVGDLCNTVCSNDEGGYYLHGDFNAWVQYSHPNDYVKFANSYQEIIKELALIEDEQTKEVDDALRTLKNEQ